MADVAVDSAIYVDTVIEVDKLGELIDAGPAQVALFVFNGSACLIALPYRIQQGAVRPDLGMAGHARVGGRNPAY